MTCENLSSTITWYSLKSSSLSLTVTSRAAFSLCSHPAGSQACKETKEKTSLWAGELGNKFRTVTSVLGKKHWNPAAVVILWEHWERADWAPALPLSELGKSNPSREKGRTYLMLSSSTWDSRGSLDRSAGSSFLSLTHEGRLGWAVDSTTGGWAVDSTTGWSFSKTANQFWQHAESISRNTK